MRSLQNPPPDEGYTKVQGAPAATQEQVPALGLIGAAYGFIWLAVLVFLLVQWRRNQQTSREMDDLKRKLEAART